MKFKKSGRLLYTPWLAIVSNRAYARRIKCTHKITRRNTIDVAQVGGFPEIRSNLGNTRLWFRGEDK